MKTLPVNTRMETLILQAIALTASVPLSFGAEAVPPKVRAGASPHVIVAYYSLTGNTEKMAHGVAEGIRRVPGVTGIVKQASEVTKQDLEAADGTRLHGAPTEAHLSPPAPAE